MMNDKAFEKSYELHVKNCKTLKRTPKSKEEFWEDIKSRQVKVEYENLIYSYSSFFTDHDGNTHEFITPNGLKKLLKELDLEQSILDKLKGRKYGES